MNQLGYQVFIDGGSRGNPGESGCGVYDKQTGRGHYYYLGKVTNNEAEYNGLLKALQLYATKKNLHIYSDSKLLVMQITGQYKVNNERLKKLHGQAINIIKYIQGFKISHVMRESNKHADKLANMAMDSKSNGILEVQIK